MSHIIAVDHGFGYIKTPNTCMLTGVTASNVEPFTLQNTVQMDGRYYICGTSRQNLTLNKTENDNYYVLTLAAIAKELRTKQIMSGTVEIILATGLPLTRFGAEKNAFKSYLDRTSEHVSFRYEDSPYNILIKDVVIYPQGYAAYAANPDLTSHATSAIIADCGSWTIDVMLVENGIPNSDRIKTIEYGMMRCISDVKELYGRRFGGTPTDSDVENVLLGGDSILPPERQQAICEGGEAYVSELLNKLKVGGFDYDTTFAVFLGGGARIVQRFAPKLADAAFLTDVCVNAKGYETIARQMKKHAK